jgi:hypothetical protein
LLFRSRQNIDTYVLIYHTKTAHVSHIRAIWKKPAKTIKPNAFQILSAFCTVDCHFPLGPISANMPQDCAMQKMATSLFLTTPQQILREKIYFFASGGLGVIFFSRAEYRDESVSVDGQEAS